MPLMSLLTFLSMRLALFFSLVSNTMLSPLWSSGSPLGRYQVSLAGGSATHTVSNLNKNGIFGFVDQTRRCCDLSMVPACISLSLPMRSLSSLGLTNLSMAVMGSLGSEVSDSPPAL